VSSDAVTVTTASTAARPTAPPEAADDTMLEVVTASADVVDDTLPDGRFLNREVSWLDFNARVLALAQDRAAPLLERAKFLAIFASNLDEFYMVRVAGLMRRQDMGLGMRSADGLGTREQLALISARARELSQEHARCFLEDVQSALEQAGIRLVLWRDLTPDQQGPLHDWFSAQLFPVLTPLAVDPAHPFPTSAGCRSTSPCWCASPTAASSTSPA
jgi:polyphosphate kinase